MGGGYGFVGDDGGLFDVGVLAEDVLELLPGEGEGEIANVQLPVLNLLTMLQPVVTFSGVRTVLSPRSLLPFTTGPEAERPAVQTGAVELLKGGLSVGLLSVNDESEAVVSTSPVRTLGQSICPPGR